jgi:hypothetical protein
MWGCQSLQIAAFMGMPVFQMLFQPPHFQPSIWQISSFVNLLTGVNLSAIKMAVVSLHSLWWKCEKCELLPFTMHLVKSPDFNWTALPAEKSTFWKSNEWWLVHHNCTEIESQK